MSFLEKITPLILTFNEAPNIGRTLSQLTWAKRIVIIDSYSTDETLDLIHSYPQVHLFQRTFDTHTNQWNFGLSQIETEWVLSLDADYVLTDELIQEMNAFPMDPEYDGYFARFVYCIYGKPLRGTLLPPRNVLFRVNRGIYFQDGHTQMLQLNGKAGMLSGRILHDDRKSLSRWLWTQEKYVVLESKSLLETPWNQLKIRDRIRRTKFLSPVLIFLYALILRGAVWDGWAGWYYVLQRTLAEILLIIHMIEDDCFLEEKHSTSHPLKNNPDTFSDES